MWEDYLIYLDYVLLCKLNTHTNKIKQLCQAATYSEQKNKEHANNDKLNCDNG